MTDDQEVLERAAMAVAEGEAVDWGRVENSHESVREGLRGLRVLENIAEVHRDTGEESEPRSIAPSERSTRSVHTETSMPALWGPLRLVEEVGHGGFSNVYRAYHPKLGTEVALKLLRPELARSESQCRRLLEEARRQVRVRHPNVLVVHDADRHDGRVGLWTDLLEGQTLEDLLREKGPFGAEEATVIGVTLCHALAAVHRAGLIHRDVKTSNVMREKGGRIVLMDFGEVIEQEGMTRRSERLSLSGTPLFMAPELLDGGAASVESDIYALGVTLYRLVTGEFPVRAETLSELRQKHRNREMTLLSDARPDLPAGFVAVVDRALDPKASDRFASAGEMEKALSTALGVPGPVDPQPPPAWWKKPLPAAAIAAGVVVIAWIVWVILQPSALQVEISLYLRSNDAEVRLLPGSKVQPGDDLFLEIEGNRQMYVYVVNQDQEGQAYVLFPLEGVEPANPLEPGSHRLPGIAEGENIYWEVSSLGGRESVSVISSVNPLAVLEEEIKSIPRARRGVPVEFAPEVLLDSLRGIAGLSVGEPSTEPDQALTSLFGNLTREASQEAGLWLWEIELVNEGD